MGKGRGDFRWGSGKGGALSLFCFHLSPFPPETPDTQASIMSKVCMSVVDNKLPLPTLDLMALSRSKTEERGNSLFMPKNFCNEG